MGRGHFERRGSTAHAKDFRYDMTEKSLSCAVELTDSQLNLPHETKNGKIRKRTKKDFSEKKTVHGGSLEEEGESVVGKICEIGEL